MTGGKYTGLILGIYLCGMMLGAGCDARWNTQAVHDEIVLPGLPSNDSVIVKNASAENTIDGSSTYSRYQTGVEPEPVHAHDSYPKMLVLDATALTEGFVWAMWQIPVGEDYSFESVSVVLYQSGMNKYSTGLADYSTGHWRFYSEGYGSEYIELTDESSYHSASDNAYVAVIVMAGSKITIGSLDYATTQLNQPIHDDYEPNNSLLAPWSASPGTYYASIYETIIPEMGGKDDFDFYRVHLEAGDYLTATLRFDVFDAIVDPNNFNDLDVLIYPPGSTLPLEEFDPDASGTNIYYYPFEQGFLHATVEGDYFVGIFGDRVPPDVNAEYCLNIYVSQSVHTVSGTLTQLGAEPSKQFVVFLSEPGATEPPTYQETCNFNDITSIDAGMHGEFSIPGVPDGEYVLRVHSSSAFYGQPYVWPEQLPVTVSGADRTGLIVDIGIDP